MHPPDRATPFAHHAQHQIYRAGIHALRAVSEGEASVLAGGGAVIPAPSVADVDVLTSAATAYAKAKRMQEAYRQRIDPKQRDGTATHAERMQWARLVNAEVAAERELKRVAEGFGES